MARVIRTFPCTLFGLLTIALFFVAETRSAAGTTGPLTELLYVVLRVIIIPLWLMRYVVVIIGGVLFGFGIRGFPAWYDVLTIPILLLPYIAVDLLLSRWWRQRTPKTHAHGS